MKARLIILIAVITLFASCKKNSGTEKNTETQELKITEAEKANITGYINSKRSKTDVLGNSSIDTILQGIKWEKFKIYDNHSGNRLTVFELIISGKSMHLLLYSQKDKTAYADAQLAVGKQNSVTDGDFIDIIGYIFTGEKTSFTGTIAYYKVTRQLLFEMGYEGGEKKFTRKFDKGIKPSNVPYVNARCTHYYLVTYWSDGSADYEYLYSDCGPGDVCEQTRSLSYSSATAFNASRCGGGGGGGGEGTTLPPDPCSDAQPAANVMTALSQNSSYTGAKNTIQAANSNVEHSITFGKDVNGNTTASSMTSCTSSSTCTVNTTWPGAFADLHNHSNDLPPSPGDIYNLISVNNNHSGYNTRMVVTPNGSVFALVVLDLAAANAFKNNYPPVNIGYGPDFPTAIFDKFQEVKDVFMQQGLSDLISEERAMSYVLDKYNTGVFLLKQDSNGTFKRLKTNESTSNGSLTYTANNCQ